MFSLYAKIYEQKNKNFRFFGRNFFNFTYEYYGDCHYPSPTPHRPKTLKLNHPRNLRKRSLSDSKFKQIGNARETTHSVKEFTAVVSTRPVTQ